MDILIINEEEKVLGSIQIDALLAKPDLGITPNGNIVCSVQMFRRLLNALQFVSPLMRDAFVAEDKQYLAWIEKNPDLRAMTEKPIAAHLTVARFEGERQKKGKNVSNL